MTQQDPSPNLPPNVDRPHTPRSVLVICYVLLALLLTWVLVQRYLRPLVLEEGVTVVSTQPAGDGPASKAVPAGAIDQRIDPNTASWAELTRLPRIGETTAKRIVAFREAQQQATGSDQAAQPVFTCPEDLEQVQGIGPKTVERIAGHLKFPATRPN